MARAGAYLHRTRCVWIIKWNSLIKPSPTDSPSRVVFFFKISDFQQICPSNSLATSLAKLAQWRFLVSRSPILLFPCTIDEITTPASCFVPSCSRSPAPPPPRFDSPASNSILATSREPKAAPAAAMPDSNEELLSPPSPLVEESAAVALDSDDPLTPTATSAHPWRRCWPRTTFRDWVSLQEMLQQASMVSPVEPPHMFTQ
jgi:hypothetical protein